MPVGTLQRSETAQGGREVLPQALVQVEHQSEHDQLTELVP